MPAPSTAARQAPGSSPISSTEGSSGMPASAAAALAASLSPMAAMASGWGPTQTSPASSTARAASARSDRKP